MVMELLELVLQSCHALPMETTRISGLSSGHNLLSALCLSREQRIPRHTHDIHRPQIVHAGEELRDPIVRH